MAKRRRHDTTIAYSPIAYTVGRVGVGGFAFATGSFAGLVSMTIAPEVLPTAHLAWAVGVGLVPPLVVWVRSWVEERQEAREEVIREKHAEEMSDWRMVQEVENSKAVQLYQIERDHEYRTQLLHLQKAQVLLERAKERNREHVLTASTSVALENAATRLRDEAGDISVQAQRLKWRRIVGEVYLPENRTKVWISGQPFSKGRIGDVQFKFLMDQKIIVYHKRGNHPQWNFEVAGHTEHDAMTMLESLRLFYKEGTSE